MNKRRLTSLSFSLLVAASASFDAIPFCTGGGAIPAAYAASHSSTADKTSPSGLDAKSLQLANKGNWPGFVEHLQSTTEGLQSPTISHGWLAFGLMFLDKGNDLNALTQKVNAMPATDNEKQWQKLVEAFNFMAQKKYDEATKSLYAVPDNEKNALADLALAAVSAKNGDAARAVEYCEKAVTIAPDFAWGYRTIGYLQDRTLKNTDAAEAAYEKALALQPEFKEVRDLLVDLRIAHNDFDGAVDIALAGVKANPRDPANYYRLSQVLTQQWRLREADQQLDKAIRLTPDNPKFHRARASILRHQKKMDEAIAEQQRAVDLSTDKAFELTELAALNELAGNDSAAADNLKKALALAPVSQAAHQAAHQKLVQLLLRGKRYEDLVEEYKRAIQVQPDNSTLHIGLAEALAQIGKTEDAMKELHTAANLDSHDPRPHRMLGAMLLQKKDYAAATRAYTRALDINPTSVDDLVSLGYTYALDDDYLKAETAFVTALALQQLTQAPGSNRPAVMRAFATLLLSEGRYSEAALNYEEVVRELKPTSSTAKQDTYLMLQARALRDRTPDSIQKMMASFEVLSDNEKNIARPALAESLLKLGKYDTAIEQLAKAPPETQTAAQWLTLDAKAYRMKGDLAKADELANKAVTAKDESENTSDAYTELGFVLLEKNDLAGAEAALHKATDLNNRSFNAYEALGRVYLKRKDIDHTLEATKRSLEINPYHVPAYLLNGDAYLAANKTTEALTNYKHAVELYPALLDGHRGLRDVYKKLAQKDEVQREEEAISRLEKQG